MENIIDVIGVAKYIVGLLGLVGLIIIIVGAFQRQHELIQRGALILITSLILFGCGYLIIRTSVDRAVDEIEMEIENYYQY